MSDKLIEIGANPVARKLIKSLGLPLPLPQKLTRTDAPWEDRPLDGRSIVFGAASGSALATTVAEALTAAGASPSVVTGDDAVAGAFRAAGEKFGRPPRFFVPGTVPDAVETHALVFDATGIDTPARLRELYDFGHAWIGKLARCGRVVVLGRPPEQQGAVGGSAAQAALDGFVRSLGKEIGRNGATTASVTVEEGADSALAGPLAFLLSPRAAFVSGQRLRVTKSALTAKGAAGGTSPSYARSLDGKVVLVTGAARGIGAATARLLSTASAKVVCLDRPADAEPLNEVVRGINGVALALDITEATAPATIAEFLRKEFGGVDVVIHNAGVTRDKTLARMTPELWDSAIDINLGAVVRITDLLLPELVRDGGRIVCLSSVAGIAGNVGQTNYSASKAGIIGFVTALAPKLSARGITVNAIAPGFIETRLTAAIPFAIREGGRRLASLGQGGLPEDVGQALTFLAMPISQGMTGGVLRVCGGAFIGA